MNTLTLTRPDDWHLHLRDGDMLAAVLPDTARRFARAIVMPNLVPPVTTVEQALTYRRHILDACPEEADFEQVDFDVELFYQTLLGTVGAWWQRVGRAATDFGEQLDNLRCRKGRRDGLHALRASAALSGIAAFHLRRRLARRRA